MAKSSGNIRIYSAALEASVDSQDQNKINLNNDNSQQQKEAAFTQLAEYFRNEGNVLEAGKFSGFSKHYRMVDFHLHKYDLVWSHTGRLIIWSQ